MGENLVYSSPSKQLGQEREHGMLESLDPHGWRHGWQLGVKERSLDGDEGGIS